MVYIKSSSFATVLVGAAALSATAGAVVLPNKGNNAPAVLRLGAEGHALNVHEGVVAREYKHGNGEGAKEGKTEGEEKGQGKGKKEDEEVTGKRSWKGRLGRRGPWRNQPEEDLINVNLGGEKGRHPHGNLIDINARHSHDHDRMEYEHDHHHRDHDHYDHDHEDLNIHSHIHARHSHDHEGKIIEIEDGHHRHHEHDGYRHEEVHEHIHARHSHDHDDVVVVDGGRHGHGEWRDGRHGEWRDGRHGDVEVHEHVHARDHRDRGGETVVVANGGRHRGSTVVVDGNGRHRDNDVTVVNQRDTIVAEGSHRHGDNVIVVDNNRAGRHHHDGRPVTIVTNNKRSPGPSFLKRHDHHDTIISTDGRHDHNNVIVDSDRHHSTIVNSDRHGSTIVDSDRHHSTIVDSDRHHTNVIETDRHGVESVVSTHHKRHSQRIIVVGNDRAYRDTDAYYRYGHESARFGRPIMFGRGDGFNRVRMISNHPWGYERVVEGYAPIRAGYGYSGYRGGGYRTGYYNKRHEHEGHDHHDHDGHREHGEWREGGDVTVVNNENGRHRHGGDVTVVNNHKRRHEDVEEHYRETDGYNRHGECRHGECDGRGEDVMVVNNKRQSSGADMGGAPGYIDVTSPVFNSTTAQRIASLVLSTSNGTDTNSTFVLNASNNIRTQVYLVPLSSNSTSTSSNTTSTDSPIAVNLKLPIFVAASASVEAYCATFDPDPSAPAPLTVTPCSNGTTSHESQKFLYSPTTGVIHPDWQPSPAAQQLLQSFPDSVDDDGDAASAQNADDDDSDLSAQDVSPTGAITAGTTGAPTSAPVRRAVATSASAPPPLVTGGPSSPTNSSTVTPSASNVTLIFTPANPTLPTESTDPTTSALYEPTPDTDSNTDASPLSTRGWRSEQGQAQGQPQPQAGSAYYPGDEQDGSSPYAYYPGDGYAAPSYAGNSQGYAPVDEEPGMGDDTGAGYTFAAPADAQGQQPMAAPESYTAPYERR